MFRCEGSLVNGVGAQLRTESVCVLKDTDAARTNTRAKHSPSGSESTAVLEVADDRLERVMVSEVQSHGV